MELITATTYHIWDQVRSGREGQGRDREGRYFCGTRVVVGNKGREEETAWGVLLDGLPPLSSSDLSPRLVLHNNIIIKVTCNHLELSLSLKIQAGGWGVYMHN